MEGIGNMATVPLIIKLLDVNDETPRFERSTFEFILQPNLRNFTSRAFIRVCFNEKAIQTKHHQMCYRFKLKNECKFLTKFYCHDKLVYFGLKFSPAIKKISGS